MTALFIIIMGPMAALVEGSLNARCNVDRVAVL